MTANDSDKDKLPGGKSVGISSRTGSRSEAFISGEELFSGTFTEEQVEPVIDPSHELNKLSYELSEPSRPPLPTNEAPESQLENEFSDLEIPPPWQAQERESADDIHIPPTVSDKAVVPPVPMAPPSSSFGGAAQRAKRDSGLGLSTVLSIVAIMVAASAIWLTKGLSEQMASIKVLEPTQTHTMDKLQNEEILTLKQQLKAMEESQKRQIQVLDKDVAALKEKIKKPVNAAVLKSRTGQKKIVQKAKPVQKRATPKIKPAAPKTVTRPAPTGGWVINLFSLNSEAAARKKMQQLRTKGINAEYARAIIKGKAWYRVRVAGLSSKQTAQKQKELLASDFGIVDAWIGKP